MDVAGEVTNTKELVEIIQRCLMRDRDWIEYHAESLAELVSPSEINLSQLQQAQLERRAFRLMRDNYFEKAISKLEKYCLETKALDQQSRGWLKQISARIAFFWGRNDISLDLQQSAYADNNNLHRPLLEQKYIPLRRPSKQAEAIISEIKNFKYRRGYIAEFDNITAFLVSTATSNQFEQALADLGGFLGFSTQRPDNNYGVGPDVLWLLDKDLALVIEVKSRKERNNPLTKEEHGQLLNASEWFKKEYSSFNHIRVSLHPNIYTSDSTVTNGTKVITFEKLNSLISETRSILVELCSSIIPDDELLEKCEQLLQKSHLVPERLIKEFLTTFQNK